MMMAKMMRVSGMVSQRSLIGELINRDDVMRVLIPATQEEIEWQYV